MLEHGAARNSAMSPTLIIRKLSFVDWSFNWDDCSFSANSWFCGNNSWFFRVKSIATIQESRALIHWEPMWVCALSLPTSPSELPYITYLFSLSPNKFSLPICCVHLNSPHKGSISPHTQNISLIGPLPIINGVHESITTLLRIPCLFYQRRDVTFILFTYKFNENLCILQTIYSLL